MAEENEYIRTLIAARVRELGHRREAAKALAKDYARGDTEHMRETFVKIQETIATIERAIAHEEFIESKEAKTSWPVAIGFGPAARSPGS